MFHAQQGTMSILVPVVWETRAMEVCFEVLFAVAATVVPDVSGEVALFRIGF